MKEVLERHKPQSFGEAKNLPGMTPAAASILLSYVKNDQYTYLDTPDKLKFKKLYNVSRETMNKLEVYEGYLLSSNKQFNLIGRVL